ncbi:hypothetical protein TcG_08730 [Trypanosoma cruzi]|nr:hypothetical protein TcG_08730 [Trypanosoma cruzi]
MALSSYSDNPRKIFEHLINLSQFGISKNKVTLDSPRRRSIHKAVATVNPKFITFLIKDAVKNRSQFIHATLHLSPVFRLLLHGLIALLSKAHCLHIALIRAIHYDPYGSLFVRPVYVTCCLWRCHQKHAPDSGRETRRRNI